MNKAAHDALGVERISLPYTSSHAGTAKVVSVPKNILKNAISVNTPAQGHSHTPSV